MAVNYSPDSGFAVESRKWEGHFGKFGPPGRPYEFREYPKALYKAGRNASGVPCIVEAIEATSDVEEANMLSRGFREGQDKALEALHAEDKAIAELAANRSYNELRMSDKARAEAAAYDESVGHHVAAIPETPIKRRGRPAKETI